MKKGSITRYDQELVLETIIDYDNAELSAWILEPIKEQIGGGGEINNPVLTINVVATGVAGDQGALPLIVNDNGILKKVNTMIVGGTSDTYQSIVLEDIYSDDDSFFWKGSDSYPDITGTANTLSVSNAVNCSIDLDQPNNWFGVTITDPTQPASFTLTIS